MHTGDQGRPRTPLTTSQPAGRKQSAAGEPRESSSHSTEIITTHKDASLIYIFLRSVCVRVPAVPRTVSERTGGRAT